MLSVRLLYHCFLLFYYRQNKEHASHRASILSNRVVMRPFIRVVSGRQAQLNRALSYFLLRRDKSLIAAWMPKKQDNIVFCKMTPLQVRMRICGPFIVFL